MARGELLRQLFLMHTRGDEDGFRAIALEIVGEEQKKANSQLAKDLLRILENGARSPSWARGPNGIGSLPKDKERQTLLVDVRHPDRSFSDILLKEETKAALQSVMEEYRKSEILRTHGLRCKNKLLFCGPPGCGKTLCAEVLSHELGLPLLYTRFDAIVSSYLGETAANLRKVFDYAATGRWVVLFDEFDAIGKARDDASEHGEIKRVINSFLQLLDGFMPTSLLIAATNHEHLLDRAIWRRFDEILFFRRPSVHEIRKLIRMKLRNFPHMGVDIDRFAAQMKGMSHADVERACLDAVKDSILTDKCEVDEAALQLALKRQTERMAVARNAGRSR